MYTINENTLNEIVINKSRFITILIRVNNVLEVKNKLEEVKDQYRDANHYCYAYVIDELKKSSDDGEPGGTAGVPIMEVLNKNKLNYVLCVVIRYFGGIKLGAGGLVRAYSKGAREAVKKANLKEIISGFEIVLFVSYEEQKQLDFILNDSLFVKEYEEKVKYTIRSKEALLDILKKKYTIDRVVPIKMI